MKVLFRFDASPALAARVAALSDQGAEIVCAPEAEDAPYEELLPTIDVLWHVLKPVTQEQIVRASKLKLIQKIGSGVNTIDVEIYPFALAIGVMLGNLQDRFGELCGRTVGLVEDEEERGARSAYLFVRRRVAPSAASTSISCLKP